MRPQRDYRFAPDGDHIRILNRNGDEIASIGLPDGEYIARDAAGERVGYASSLGEALTVLLQDWEERQCRALRAEQDARRLAFGLPIPPVNKGSRAAPVHAPAAHLVVPTIA